MSRRWLCVAAILVASCVPAPGPPVTGTPAPTSSPPSSASASPSPVSVASPTPTPTPTPSPSASPSRPAEYCAVADELAAERDYDHPERTVLDPTHALPADYVPPDLTSATGGGPGGAQERVRRIAYDDLAALRAAAAAAGSPVVVVSGYRSYEEQKATFEHWVRVGGYEQALLTSARAGHSEHQLGTAVDLGDGSKVPWEYDDWAATPTGAWVAANATSFGFVMSYPKDRTDVTCYAYEPWHYRWVGREMAARVAASGLTLHEFQMSGR